MKEASVERTCLFCRKGSHKRELLRFVWDGTKVVWDRNQVMPGRGGYCHRRVECLTKLSEMGPWNRAFKVVGVELTLAHVKEAREFLLKEVPEFQGFESGKKGLKEGKNRKVRL